MLEAARSAGFNIPSLCFLKDINEIGACRICVVEVKGAKSLVASCVYPVAEGMEVYTNTCLLYTSVSRLAAAFGGAAFPAHIDRPSFSLLGVLGLWMPELGFPLAEVSRQCPPEFRLRPDLAGLRLIANSDAHYLDPVSYTHLDVYKRQPQKRARRQTAG